MTYPFAGEIKMTKVIKDGKEVIEWEEVKWDASAPLVIGEPVERTTEWARVDKDLNVTHLDMDLCRKGQQNEYTALAIAIWDAATKAAQKEWQGLSDQEIVDLLNKYFHSYPDLIHVVHMIEAILKEKNG
jgi:hypothetical protein